MRPPAAPTHRRLDTPPTLVRTCRPENREVADRAGHREAEDDRPEPPGQGMQHRTASGRRQVEGQHCYPCQHHLEASHVASISGRVYSGMTANLDEEGTGRGAPAPRLVHVPHLFTP